MVKATVPQSTRVSQSAVAHLAEKQHCGFVLLDGSLELAILHAASSWHLQVDDLGCACTSASVSIQRM